jgi:hypothetical protein
MKTTVLDVPTILVNRIDEVLADEWNAPPVAGYLPRGQCAQDLCLVALAEPIELSLNRLTPVQGTAAVVSALGWAAQAGGGVRLRVRIAVAVTCCGSAGLMRSKEGAAVVPTQIDGELIGDLRRWAGLHCAHPDHARISTGSLPDG